MLKANREKKEQFAVLASMSEIYHSMHLIRLDENSVMEYSGTKEESEMGKNRENADQVIAELMKETALEVYGDQAEAFVDFTTLAKRMEGKKIISAEFVGKDLEWFRALVIEITEDQNKHLEYQKQTALDYLRNHLDEDHKRISITYRRKENEKYKVVTMEVIPADDYTTENRAGFLYVKG